MRPALKATDRNNTHLNTKSNVQTVMVQNAWQLNFKGCNVNLQTENDAFQLGMQQIKRKCCLYYLTLKIMSKLHVLIKLKPKELHKPFSLDFFFFKIAIKEKGKISAIPMMTIMTMISSYDKPRSHSGLFIRRI